MSSRPVRLPPLPRLRVKRPNDQKQVSPCVVMMSTLLNCWSSNGEGAAECKALELNLKECMEINQTQVVGKKSSINYHASRLYPKINGKPHD